MRSILFRMIPYAGASLLGNILPRTNYCQESNNVVLDYTNNDFSYITGDVRYKDLAASNSKELFKEAIGKGRGQLAQIILEQFPNLITAEFANNRTALHNALVSKDNNPFKYSIVKFLIENGSDVNLPDKFGNTPLIFLVNCDNDVPLKHKILELLLEKGADVNIFKEKKGYLWRPLDVAIERNDLISSQMLIKKGSQINPLLLFRAISAVQTNKSSILPKDNVLSLLLDNGVKTNVICDGIQPVHLVVRNLFSCHVNKVVGILDLLLKNDADVNCQDNDGNTPLHLFMTCVNQYIKTYCKDDVTSPIALLALEHAKKVYSMLIDNGARLDIRNNEGKEPFDLLEYKSIKHKLSNKQNTQYQWTMAFS